MLPPDIIAELEQDKPTDFHTKLLSHCKSLIKMSGSVMGDNYPRWDHSDDVFAGRRTRDSDDKAAAKRKEPEKLIVPMSYAQIMTFVCFLFLLFTQRDNFYELESEGDEQDTDEGQLAEDCQAVLRRDLKRNRYQQLLFQFLLDLARFGIAIKKHGWVKETVRVNVKRDVQTSINPAGLGEQQQTTQTTSREELTKYIGNRMMSVSPYRFFPDTRLPLTRWDEGEFVGSEDEYSRTTLLDLQKQKIVAGVNKITAASARMFKDRGFASRNSLSALLVKTQDDPTKSLTGGNAHAAILVTELQVKIVPSEFKLENGKHLGTEDFPVTYIVWYANDQRIIRCEPLDYLHGGFTYVVSQFTPDMHNTLNEGLSDTIEALQSIITWLINAHVASMRKNIDNRLVGDPNMIEMEDIQERRPFIRTKKDASRSTTGIGRYLMQLQTTDVTQAFMNDVQAFIGIIQMVTGINENAMAQYSQGRRDATQTRSVNSAAASRMITVAKLVWESALEPEGQMLLTNLRDGLDLDSFLRIIGKDADQARYVQFRGTPEDLIQGTDFVIFDGTIPSERGALAQRLQDLIIAISTNPEAAMTLQFDPQKLWMQMLRLSGVRNPQQYKLSPQQMQQMQQQQMMMQMAQNIGKGGAGGPPSAPGQQQPPALSTPPPAAATA